MKQKIKEWLETFKKTGTCPVCGFDPKGIFRWHNSHGECELMNNLKISEVLEEK